MSCPFCMHKPHGKSDPGSPFPPAPLLRDWDRHSRVQGHIPSWGAHFHAAPSHLLPGHVSSGLHHFPAINMAAPGGTSSSRAHREVSPSSLGLTWGLGCRVPAHQCPPNPGLPTASSPRNAAASRFALQGAFGVVPHLFGAAASTNTCVLLSLLEVAPLHAVCLRWGQCQEITAGLSWLSPGPDPPHTLSGNGGSGLCSVHCTAFCFAQRPRGAH